jgi:hypothetical protein
VAVRSTLAYAPAGGGGLPDICTGIGTDGVASAGGLSEFRERFYACLGARADELFELTDALLCAATRPGRGSLSRAATWSWTWVSGPSR